MMMFVLKLDLLEEWIAEASRSGQGSERGDGDGGHGRDPQPGDDLRRGQWQLDPPQELLGGHPHPAPRVLRVGGHVGKAREGVAVDDLKGVGGERDDGRREPEPGHREKQEEERDARHGVEHARDAEDRRSKRAVSMREQSRAPSRSRTRRRPRSRRSPGGGRTGSRSGRSCRRPSRSRRGRCRPRTPTGCGGGRSSTAARARTCRPRPRATGSMWRRARVIRRPPARPRSAPPSAPHREVRNSETISTERTPAIRPSASTTGA